VLLVGAESAAVQVLQGLAGSEHEVVAVLAEAQESSGSALARVAGGLGLPVLEARSVREPALATWIAAREVDLLLNVHSLSIVHDEVTRAPRIGSFNLHPGPLPAYAGLNVVTWAIARGELTHGVTLHWMNAGIDTGAVAYSETFPIAEEDTGLTVFTKCVRQGVPLVRRLLEAAARDPRSIPAERQVGERTVYRRKDVPHDGRIDWSRPAREVHDLLRACDFGPFPSPCGHPVARLDGREMAFVGASLTHQRCAAAPGTVGQPRDGAATVATADEWLAVRRLVVEGRPAPACDLLPPGARLAGG
jgi:methionyl-tRNA formyltransferase